MTLPALTTLHALHVLDIYFKAANNYSAKINIMIKTRGLIQHDRILTNRVHNDV